MEREKTRGRTRRKQPSRVAVFLHREGRRWCAIALSVCMILSNMAGTAFAANVENEDNSLFKLTSDSLYKALQQAVLDKNIVDEEMLFLGKDEDQEEYKKLLEMNDDLYELKPVVKNYNKELKLRIFASLDWGTEEGQEYKVMGSEKFIFLFTNQSETEQMAVVQVDEKQSEIIRIAPKEALCLTEGETEGEDSAESEASVPDATENSVGENGTGGSGVGGNGSGGGGTGGNGTMGSSADENDAAESSADESSEETDEAETAPGTDFVEETESREEIKESADRADEEGKEETKEETKAEEELPPAGEENGGQDDENKQEEDNGQENEKEQAEDKEQVSDKEQAAEKNTEEAGLSEEKNPPEEGKNQEGNRGPEEGTAQEADKSQEERNEPAEKADTLSAAISRNRIQAVAVSLEEDEEESSHEASKASSSEASPSDAEEQLLEGVVYNSILMNEEAVNIFVTTARDLGLDKDEFKSLQIYETEIDDFTVRVGAEKGVLPEDAQLRVTELKEEEEEHAEQYQEAKEALDKEEIDYDEMMALDISFFDQEGNEIEPNGEVKVSIKLNPARIPEEVLPESISVQHLEEKKNGEVQAVQVADVADETKGKVEVNEEEAIAEFSVESFSTFTITWKYSNYNRNGFNITFHYVNTFGEEIYVPVEKNANSTILDKKIELTEAHSYIKAANTSLSFKGAYLEYQNNDNQGREIDSIELKTIGNNWNVTYQLNFNKGSTTELTLNSAGTTKTADVYLVYETPNVTQEPGGVKTKEISRSKTVMLNEDGTYNLNLSLSGAVGNKEKKQKMDILLIVDNSGSMKWTMNSTSSNQVNGNAERRTRRIDKAAEAVNGLIEEIGKSNGIDARYSIVKFSSRDKTNVVLDWSSNANQVADKIREGTPNGGTNYQEGISLGKQLLNSARGDSQTIVIFLTDGLPTYHNGENGAEIGDGNSDDAIYNGWALISPKNGNISAAKEEIRGMKCSAFYAIGVGSDFNNLESTTLGTPVGNLHHLCLAVKEGNAKTVTGKYAATKIEDLEEAFSGIVAGVTQILCDHVTLTDKLSDNVFAVIDDGKDSPEMTITVTEIKNEGGKESREIKVNQTVSSGEKVTVPAGQQNETPTEIWATYDKKQKTVELHFPETYKLEPDWEYTVSMKIDATEAAYQKFRGAGLKYEEGMADKPEEGTGTHANELGYYSNVEDDSKVTYYYENKEEEPKIFPKPVIQVRPGTLLISKTIEGLSSDKKNELKAKLIFKVELEWKPAEDASENAKKTKTFYYSLEGKRFELGNEGYVEYNESEENPLSLKVSSSENTDGTYSLKFEGLSPNTKCTVEEVADTAKMPGYELTELKNPDNASVVIARAGTETISFTNTYKKSQVDIMVDKQLNDWITPTNGGPGVEAVTFELHHATITGGKWNLGEIVENGTLGISAVISSGSEDLSHGISAKMPLAPGYYMLVEKTTAPGYRLPEIAEAIRIVVEAKEGKLICYAVDGSGKTVDGLVTLETGNGSSGNYWQVNVKNDRIYTSVLPDTGGPGLAMFERCGWFLLMMALMMAGMEVQYYGERRRRVRVDEMKYEAQRSEEP